MTVPSSSIWFSVMFIYLLSTKCEVSDSMLGEVKELSEVIVLFLQNLKSSKEVVINS